MFLSSRPGPINDNGYQFAGAGGIPAIDLTVFTEDVENIRTNLTTAFVGKPVGHTFGERLETNGANLLLKSQLGATTLRYGLNHHRRHAEAVNPTKKGAAGGSSDERSEVSGLFAEGQRFARHAVPARFRRPLRLVFVQGQPRPGLRQQRLLAERQPDPAGHRSA